MKALEVEGTRPYFVPLPMLAYGLGILLTIFIAVITGMNWQAGVTLALAFGYMVLVSVQLEWGVYTILAFSVLCIDGWAPNRSPEDVVFRLAVGHIYIMEFAVYGLLVAYLIRRAFDKAPTHDHRFFVPTPLDAPLRVFAVLLPIFAFYGLVLGNPTKVALGYEEWRSLFMAIVLYFLITSIFTSREKALKLFWAFLGLNTAIGLYSLTLYFLGTNGPFPLVLGTGPIGEGPENYTFMFGALCAIAWLLFCREKGSLKRKLIWLAAIIPLLNILLSEKRDPQLGLLVGLATLTWRIPFQKKMKLGIAAATLGAAVLLFVGALGIRTHGGGLEKSVSRYTEVTELVENPRSLLNLQGTLAFHILDLVDSFNSIRLRPILGYGFGGEFIRHYTALASVGGLAIQPGIVHDQYLDFGVKMGLVGLFAFLWMLARFVRYSHAVISKNVSSEYETIALGLYSAVWGDIAIEFWGASWRGGTKMPTIFLVSFALVVCLLRKGSVLDT